MPAMPSSAWALVRAEAAAVSVRGTRGPRSWLAVPLFAVVVALVLVASAGRPGEAVAEWVRRTLSPARVAVPAAPR